MRTHQASRRPVSARRWLDQDYLQEGFDPIRDRKRGKASRFISHFDELATTGNVQAVVLHCRVSSSSQNLKGNLRSYERFLRGEMRKLGIKVVETVREAGVSGFVLGDSQFHRGRLERAARIANEHGIIILSYSTDRLLRNEYFNSKTNSQAWPTKGEFRKLQQLTHGVQLATFFDPDLSLNEIRGEQSKLGQQSKCNRGGRPRSKFETKKQIRQRLLPKVYQFWETGKSVRRIARELGVAHKTVDGWVQKFKLGVRIF